MDAATPSVLHAILEEFAAPSEVFEIEIGKSKLTFKPLVSYRDIKELGRLAKQYVKRVKEGKLPNPNNADEQTLIMAFSIAYTSVEPKLSEGDLLEIEAKAGFVFNSLANDWNKHQTKPQLEAESEEVDELKND